MKGLFTLITFLAISASAVWAHCPEEVGKFGGDPLSFQSSAYRNKLRQDHFKNILKLLHDYRFSYGQIAFLIGAEEAEVRAFHSNPVKAYLPERAFAKLKQVSDRNRNELLAQLSERKTKQESLRAVGEIKLQEAEFEFDRQRSILQRLKAFGYSLDFLSERLRVPKEKLEALKANNRSKILNTHKEHGDRLEAFRVQIESAAYETEFAFTFDSETLQATAEKIDWLIQNAGFSDFSLAQKTASDRVMIQNARLKKFPERGLPYGLISSMEILFEQAQKK